jgi:hypothetical protein
VKADRHKPIEFGIVLGVLLMYRVGVWVSEKASEKGKRPHTIPSPEPG